MSEYQHYVTYRDNTDAIADRAERTQRIGYPTRPRHAGRNALARRLHSIADRLEG